MPAPTTLSLILSLASAQAPSATAPAEPAPAASQPAAPPLLSGPEAVEDDAGKLTIVQRTFDGRVENVGPEPDAVAIALLDLTPEQKQKYHEVASARMTAFDQIVRSNYGLVLEIASLQGDPDLKRRVEVLARMQQALRPYIDRGTFYHEMWPHLTDPQRQEVEVMIAEYQYERSEWLRREAEQGASRRAIAVRERIETFGQMLRESIERQVGLDRDNFETVATELDLTGEQRNAALAIFQPLAVKRFQNIEVSKAEQSAAFAEFNKLLNAGQKQRLLSMLLRRYQPPPAATQPH